MTENIGISSGYFHGALAVSGEVEVVDEREYRIGQLRQAISETHAHIGSFLAGAFDHAVTCGGLLAEAKELCEHGEFTPFVESCNVHPRMAQRYMKIYNNRDYLNTTYVSDLSIRGADKALRKARREAEAEENAPPPLTAEELAGLEEKVVCCDFRQLDLAEGTVDVIVTDPPYAAEFLPLYQDLAHFAFSHLKDGGLLAVMAGQIYLPYVYEALGGEDSPLDYHWTFAYLTPGGQAAQLWTRNVNTFWKPILLFSKGEYNGAWMGDVVKSSANDNDKKHHHWGQSESGMRDLLERVSRKGDLVCDPFVGGGTTAVVSRTLDRAFVGCDINPGCVTTTNNRLAELREQS